MLIRSIRAENFRRFETVEVEHLPEHGLIGIEGPNESGKSTLGELLLFAFFGRARGEIDVPVSSLIRWGAESLRVEVEFLVRSIESRKASRAPADGASLPDSPGAAPPPARGAEDGDYLIYREIDRRGSSFVKVLKLPEREEVAVGPIDVRRFVAREIRFDFDEFRRSFYHGQLEKRRWKDSESESDEVAFLEVATGISYLRDAIQKARASSREHEEAFTAAQTELERNRAQIERHERNVQKIPPLTEKLEGLETSVAEKEAVVAAGREEVKQLRGEARRLEGRAAALEAARSGGLAELAVVVGKALEDERCAGGGVSRKQEWKSAFRKPRDLLEKADGCLRDLLDLRGRVAERIEEIVEESSPGATEGAPGEYRRCEEAAQVLLARRRRLGVASVILVVATLLAAGAAVSVWRAVFTLDPELQRIALGVSGAVTGVFLFLSAWCLALGSAAKRRWEEQSSALQVARARLGALESERRSLEGLFQLEAVEKVGEVVERACGMGERRVRKKAAEIGERHEGLLATSGGSSLESALAKAMELDRGLAESLLAAAQKIRKKMAGGDGALKKLVSDRDRVASELRECRSQEKKKVALQEKSFEVEVVANAARAEVATLLQAIDLLEEAVVSIRTRARPAIVDYLKTALPRLTGDRYRDLKVEEDLQIKVFSSAKGDFLAIPELSGGTGEALGLSLRLALSQAFVMARVGQAQFVFLDEPFKMMDGARSIATLCALEELSAELRQIFVAQPNFGDAERDRCCYLIRTDGRSDRLVIRPVAPGEATAAPSRGAQEEASGRDEPKAASGPELALGTLASSFGDADLAPLRTTTACAGASTSDAEPLSCEAAASDLPRRSEPAGDSNGAEPVGRDRDETVVAEPGAEREGQDAPR